MSDKKITPLEEAQALIKAHQKARIAAVKAGLKALLEEQQVTMMSVPGEYAVGQDGTTVISPGRIAFRAV